MRAAPGDVPSKTYASRPVSPAYSRAMARTVSPADASAEKRDGAAASAAGDLGAVDTTRRTGRPRQRDQSIGTVRAEAARGVARVRLVHQCTESRRVGCSRGRGRGRSTGAPIPSRARARRSGAPWVSGWRSGAQDRHWSRDRSCRRSAPGTLHHQEPRGCPARIDEMPRRPRWRDSRPSADRRPARDPPVRRASRADRRAPQGCGSP